MRIRDWSSDVCSSDLDAEAVAGGVADLDLAGPRLPVDVDAELSRDRVDVVDVEVGEGTRRSVAGVLGEAQMHLAAAQEQVARQVRTKAGLAGVGREAGRAWVWREVSRLVWDELLKISH